MGKMSDQHIEKQEELSQEELEQQDLDEQQQIKAEIASYADTFNVVETAELIKKAGFKLVFNDKDLEEMVKIQEKNKNSLNKLRNIKQLLKFKDKEYNIADVTTSKNLNYMQAQEILNLNIIVKTLDLVNSAKKDKK